MKAFVSIVALLAIIAGSSAASTSAQVNAEFSTLINITIPKTMNATEFNLTAGVLTSLEPYELGYGYSRITLVEKMKQIGNLVTGTVQKYDQLITECVQAINSTFIRRVIDPEYTSFMTNLQKPIIDLLTAQKTKIYATLSKYPAGTKCWNNYTSKFEDVYESFLQGFLTQAQALTSFSKVITSEIDKFIDIFVKFEAAVRKDCGGKAMSCYADYVSFKFKNLK
jgi:hypothetical protein